MTDRAKAKLAEEGFDPAYGARPLKRVIQQRLANPLATALLERRIEEGDHVEIDWNGKSNSYSTRSGSKPARLERRCSKLHGRKRRSLPSAVDRLHYFVLAVDSSRSPSRRMPAVAGQ